jgi:glutathione synthase
MKLAFIADPLESFKIYKDSTYVMMVEAAARGAQLFVGLQRDVALLEGGVKAKMAQIQLLPHNRTDDHPTWYKVVGEQVMALTEFDAVVMRKDPPFDMEYIYSTYLLEHAVRQGARVLNDPRAVRDHSEKLSITEFPQFTAPTIVTRSADDLRAFVKEHGQAIFKLLDGMGGASIFQARVGDANLSVIIETMNEFGARSVMAQRYLPEIAQGDKRILLIDGKVVPFTLARIPKAGESRGNLAAGGRGEARELTKRDREIAETLAPILAQRGLFLVGLDVIGDCLTEINVTSPTGFQEITQQKQFNVASLFMDQLQAQVASSTRKPEHSLLTKSDT